MKRRKVYTNLVIFGFFLAIAQIVWVKPMAEHTLGYMIVLAAFVMIYEWDLPSKRFVKWFKGESESSSSK